MYYPLSASLALFANLIRNPEDPNAWEDLSLIQLVLTFLTSVMASDRSIAAGRTFAIFQELHRTATAHVSKASAQSLPKEKRKRAHDQPNNRGLSDDAAVDTFAAPGPDASSQTPPIPISRFLSKPVTAPSIKTSAFGLPSASIGLPEDIPGMGMSSFEWEMSNLWGWGGSEDNECSNN